MRAIRRHWFLSILCLVCACVCVFCIVCPSMGTHLGGHLTDLNFPMHSWSLSHVQSCAMVGNDDMCKSHDIVNTEKVRTCLLKIIPLYFDMQWYYYKLFLDHLHWIKQGKGSCAERNQKHSENETSMLMSPPSPQRLLAEYLPFFLVLIVTKKTKDNHSYRTRFSGTCGLLTNVKAKFLKYFRLFSCT